MAILETIADYKGRTDALSNMLFTDLKNLYRSTNDLSEKFNMSFEDLQKIGFAVDCACCLGMCGAAVTGEKRHHGQTAILLDFDE